MTDEQRQCLERFIRALDAVNIKTGGDEAACHHSAVEVNEWEHISAELASLMAN
jgi:hypothetical protein